MQAISEVDFEDKIGRIKSVITDFLMTTVAPETTLGSLQLDEGDVMTAMVENGEIVITVFPVNEIKELEASLIEARKEPGKPMDRAYFDGLRESVKKAV